MKPSFYIQPETIDTTNASLFIEINTQGLSYIILNGGVCVAMVMYKFTSNTPDEMAADNIHQVIMEQPVLKQNFTSVTIIYGYASSVLIPGSFINNTDNDALLQLVYGEAGDGITRTDEIKLQPVQNVYRVPGVIEMVMKRYFELARFTHLFSLLPGIAKGPAAAAYCIFSSGQFTVMLTKDGAIQALQNYCYKTPEDVAYQLIFLSNSFGINAMELTIRLSGMIDEYSLLYTELYKYFLLLVFDELPAQYQYPEELNKYPAHYFSHLFAVALCV